MKPRRRFRPKMWVVIALSVSLIIGLILAGTAFAYRAVLEREYVNSLRRRLNGSLELLEAADFSPESAGTVHNRGIRLIVIRDADGAVIYREDGVELLFRGEASASAQEDERARGEESSLRALVEARLGDSEGSFYAADSDLTGLENTLHSEDLYMLGRSEGYLFCLNLPVESTNAAVNVAGRYAAVIGVSGGLVGILIIYLVSLSLTHSQKQIAGVAEQISNLDFSQRCSGAPTREMNDLSCSINRMADRLESGVDKLRRANERLQEELDERTRQKNRITELLANLSHDLKTPIAVISGYAEGLQEGVARTPEQQDTYYTMIQQESEHMLGIVRRMLSLTQLESGEIPLEMETFDAAQLTDEVLSLFRRELERLGLETELDYPHPLPVCTDYESIRQSVINYVQNAVYHINNGNRIRISADREGDRVILRVANSSEPILDWEIPKLWEKLYRGDLSRQRSHGEAGLGLCIVKGNMSRLGLSCGCRNLEAEGMVEFWLELPACDGPAPEAPAESDAAMNGGKS